MIPPGASGAVRWATLVASLLVIVASLVVIARGVPLAELLRRATVAVEELGPLAPLAFAGLYVLACLLLVPGSPLTLAAGALFGPWLGTLVVWTSATLTAALAFLVARHLARHRVAEIAQRHPRFAAVDRAIAEEGWKVVALLRLSPALPFSISNYLYGLTGVRFWPYVAASAAAMLPATFLYVLIGHLAASGIEGGARRPVQVVLLVAGIAATVAASVLVARVARRKLPKSVRTSTATGSEPARFPWAVVAIALVLGAIAAFVLLVH